MDALAAADAAVARTLSQGPPVPWGVRTIVPVAPWLGVLATCLAIPQAFGGMTGDRWNTVCAIIGGLGDACVFVAAGFATGLLAVWVQAGLEHMQRDLARSALQSWAELRPLLALNCKGHA